MLSFNNEQHTVICFRLDLDQWFLNIFDAMHLKNLLGLRRIRQHPEIIVRRFAG